MWRLDADTREASIGCAVADLDFHSGCRENTPGPRGGVFEKGMVIDGEHVYQPGFNALFYVFMYIACS